MRYLTTMAYSFEAQLRIVQRLKLGLTFDECNKYKKNLMVVIMPPYPQLSQSYL